MRHVERAGIGDRGHFDGGLGAVEKRIEHLRIHAGRFGLGGGKAVMLPHAVRRDGVIGRQIFGALAGGRDLEARRARPVDHFGNQRRLIAIGHRIDHAGRARLAGELGAGQRIGLDIDHDDVLAAPRSPRAHARCRRPDRRSPRSRRRRARRRRRRGRSSTKRVRAMRAASQPTVRHAALARSRSRSAITATSRPLIDGTCARNIEPNFPAPISPTRTGLLASTRAARRDCRFISTPPPPDARAHIAAAHHRRPARSA